ncbi:MAG: heme exporter protein CcmB [Legionellaceae bacterium]|jgi:heme exporter protein B|nr:heme exporter protein CcmB [Legionellaceae bacterium]
MMFLKQAFLREITLQKRQFRGTLNACLFFFMVVMLFPLSFPSDPVFLRQLLPGLVWIAVLFAFFLSAEHLFQQEHEDGVLEQWVLSRDPMQVRIRIKLLVHWFVNLVPLILFCPILAILFNLNLHEVGVLSLSLVCATPTMLALCAFSSVFGIGLKRQGLFTALILLPLTLPVIVFGGGVLTAAMQGMPISGHLALLSALSILAFWGLPWAISGVIRASMA